MEKAHQKPGKKSKMNHSVDETSTGFSKKKQLALQIPDSPSASSVNKSSSKKQPGLFKKHQSTARASSNAEKKPFDKKKWRMQKYDNKFKLQQWEEKRKKAITKRYERDIKNDAGPKFDVKKIYEQADLEERDSSEDESCAEHLRGNKRQKNINKRASLEARQEQLKKIKAEKEAALEKYKKEKAKNAKRLGQRTKKGQPVMKGRMEMLLERIQKNLS